MIRFLTVVVFILPLGLDTLALSTALGSARITRGERLRASLILTGFEAIMPFVGFVVGRGVASGLGSFSDYAASALLVVLGLFMLWPREDRDEAGKVALLQRARGMAILALGLGVSLDELAIGFGGGLLRLPLAWLAALIAAQAFLMAQVGMHLGSRLGEGTGEWAERGAGLLLVAAGVFAVLQGQTGL
jgi:putative Mn2+ efflux pump MntP